MGPVELTVDNGKEAENDEEKKRRKKITTREPEKEEDAKKEKEEEEGEAETGEKEKTIMTFFLRLSCQK